MKRLLLITFVLLSETMMAQSYIDFYFKSKGVDGSILIYNETKNSWIFNNEFDLDRPTPPGHTFNIVHTLMGLDMHQITTEDDAFFRWDRINRYYFGLPMKSWNCDTNFDKKYIP